MFCVILPQNQALSGPTNHDIYYQTKICSSRTHILFIPRFGEERKKTCFLAFCKVESDIGFDIFLMASMIQETYQFKL